MKKQQALALLFATTSVSAIALAGCKPKEETPTPPATGRGTTTGGAPGASPGAPGPGGGTTAPGAAPTTTNPPGPGGQPGTPRPPQ